MNTFITLNYNIDDIKTLIQADVVRKEISLGIGNTIENIPSVEFKDCDWEELDDFSAVCTLHVSIGST